MRKTGRCFGLLVCAALLLAACGGDSNLPTATGKSAFRIINSIPTSPSIALLIEERAIGSAEYKGISAPAEYDDLSYTFNFEAFLAGNTTRTRLGSMLIDVERDMEYTFLLSGQLATPNITLWQSEKREWQASDTGFRVRFAHTAESLGPIDVYFLAPGVVPAAGQEAGSLAFTEILPAIDYAAGDYVLTVTSAGNPGDILFTSTTLTPLAQAGLVISVFDADANDVWPLAVRQFPDSGGAGILIDVNSTPTVRLFHASSNMETADVYTDEALTSLLVANHAYRDVTPDLPLAADTYKFGYTAAGNVGSILFQGDVTLSANNHYDYYIVGEAGTLGRVLQVADRRPVETLAKFSFMHTATSHPLIDLYLVTAGTDIADVFPRLINLTVGIAPVTTSLQSGDFEMYVTTAGEKTVLAGPIAFSPQVGDILDYISYDNVDPAIIDVVQVPLP